LNTKHVAWFQVYVTMKVRSALFRDFAQRIIVMRYRRFGTTCWTLECGRKNPKRAQILLNTILSCCESWGKNLELECSVEEDSWTRRHEETEELTELHLVLYRLYSLCYTVGIITPINVRLTAYVHATWKRSIHTQLWVSKT
jgi:hypothetical protein